MNKKYSQSSGFSLIELMIASTLGLFIVGGVITSFVGTKDSEQMRSAISEMDSNARIALETLRQNIAHTGYSSMRNILFDKPFYSAQDGEVTDRVCGDGSQLNATGFAPDKKHYTRDGTRTDVLTTIYLADNPCRDGRADCPTMADVNPEAMLYVDCTGGGATRSSRAVACSTALGIGMSNPEDAKIYNTFFLGAGSSTNKRTLYCSGNRGGPQPMAENIEYMQFLYGVTRNNGTTEYLSADEVETAADATWSNVTSVRVGLLVRSSQKNLLKKAAEKNKYILLDEQVVIDTAELRRLYRVYTTTINLPNRIRGATIL
jgi:type IV pilus assembly protein PilW